MSDTYSVNVECSNCDHKGQAELPKGTPVPNAIACPHCGCVTARKVAAVRIREMQKPWLTDSQDSFRTLIVGPPEPLVHPMNLPDHGPHRLTCTAIGN